MQYKTHVLQCSIPLLLDAMLIINRYFLASNLYTTACSLLAFGAFPNNVPVISYLETKIGYKCEKWQ